MHKDTESLKRNLVDIALSMGGVGARVADLEMLKRPPLADPTYVLFETQGTHEASPLFGYRDQTGRRHGKGDPAG